MYNFTDHSDDNIAVLLQGATHFLTLTALVLTYECKKRNHAVQQDSIYHMLFHHNEVRRVKLSLQPSR